MLFLLTNLLVERYVIWRGFNWYNLFKARFSNFDQKSERSDRAIDFPWFVFVFRSLSVFSLGEMTIDFSSIGVWRQETIFRFRVFQTGSFFNFVKYNVFSVSLNVIRRGALCTSCLIQRWAKWLIFIFFYWSRDFKAYIGAIM